MTKAPLLDELTHNTWHVVVLRIVEGAIRDFIPIGKSYRPPNIITSQDLLSVPLTQSTVLFHVRI